jgi:hypothetical protein
MDAPDLTLGFTLAAFVLAGVVKGVTGLACRPSQWVCWPR